MTATIIWGALLAAVHLPLALGKFTARIAAGVLSAATTAAAIFLTLNHSPETGTFAGVESTGYFAPDGIGAFFTYLLQGLCVPAIFFALRREKPRIMLYAMLLFQLSAWVVAATDSLLLFLFAWETMGLATFFLATNEKNYRPALNYLVQMHIGGLCLLAAYAMSGAEKWSELELTGITATLMALGFGFKAGLPGLHTWLGPTYGAVRPRALPVFGLAVNLGLYGFARIYSILPESLMFGVGTAWVFWGVTGSLYGVLQACVDGDAIRVPAFSTMENMGLITTALGAAALGAAGHLAAAAVPAFVGAMLHVANHAVAKSLLFFTAAGAVERLSSTRMDAGGGLLKTAPRLGFLALFASAAICGLPPLNAFSSELLIYLALFNDLERTEAFSLIVSLTALLGLCLAGGLSIFAFARWFGVIFLGRARKFDTPTSKDPPLEPAYALAAAALAAGLFPGIAMAWVQNVLHAQPFSVGEINTAAWALVCVGTAVYLLRRAMNRKKRIGPVWGCGYPAITPKIQYTAHAFSQSLGIFQKEKTIGLNVLFPEKARLRVRVGDGFSFALRRLAHRFLNVFLPLSILQTGQIRHYLLYAFVFILVLMGLTAFGAM
jgi:formate hydrogenlyase subunit 3/multisubunit Na+/H+ antiporter MnhD subunit